MILRFNIMPSHNQWKISELKQESLTINVFPQKKDLQVKIISR